MIYTQPPFAHEVHDPGKSQSGPGSLHMIPIILTASVVFLAVDATINLIRQRAPLVSTCVEPTSDPSTPEWPSLTRFVDKTRSILADVQVIERQLSNEMARRMHRACERKRLLGRRFDTKDLHPRPRAPGTTSTSNTATSEPSCAFSAFCDRLLLTNHIWKQERELKSLHASCASTSKDRASNAFNTFCTQLLLHNRVWQREREARMLAVERKRVESARAAAVTRAAKRMVHEVQKDRMVEEFVKDLIEEVRDAKRKVEQVQKVHEREVEEIHGVWMRDYRQVVGEVERLKLARRAGWVEQDVANGMEESLIEHLGEEKRRIEALEKRIADSEVEGEVTLNDMGKMLGGKLCDHDDEATDVELETISLSSSQTCVSSGGSIRKGSPQRRRCISHRPLTPSSIVDAEAAFVLNPLMVDQAKSVLMLSANIGAATRTCNHSGRPLAVRKRTTSQLSFGSPTTSSSGSKVVGPTKKAPWRV